MSSTTLTALALPDAIHAQGFLAPSTFLWDGEIHRFPTDQKRLGKKDGWYLAYDDARGQVVVFGSWRQGDEKHTWSNGKGRTLTAEDWAAIEAKKRAAEAAMKARRQQAARTAAAVYAQAATTGTSAYLTRKGIQPPLGVRFVKDLAALPLGFAKAFSITGLVVPVVNASGALTSVQFIPDSEGLKYFLPGGQMGGGFHVLGTLDQAPIIAIAEGLATAQSVVEATGWPVVVAFSAGNLVAVASILRSRHPQAALVLAGDDDPVGRAKATEAAEGVKGRAVFPPAGVNDFNDLHQAHGLQAVAAALQPPDAEDPLWRTELLITAKDDGNPIVLCRVHNLVLILENDPEWRGKLGLNEFSQTITAQGQEWTDARAYALKAWLEKGFIPGEVKTSTLHEAVEVVAARHPYHPVRDYLTGLRWDGEERIPTFFTDFCGTPFSAYSVAVARSLFFSAVARMLTPGCKVDTMVVLEGEQGTGKSQLVLALFTPAHHMEVTEAPGSVDFYQSLRGRWCCEFGEMASFAKADKNRIKQVLTQVQDTYRASYARHTRTYPRQNIFIGTTNRDDWGDDETGLRRFLPIRCTEINVAGAAAVRDQLWAEAVVAVQRGATWWEIPDAEREQEARYQQDAWEEAIADFLQHRQSITVLEILDQCLGLKADRQGKSEQTRVGCILRRLKWQRKRETASDRKRFYVPPRKRE